MIMERLDECPGTKISPHWQLLLARLEHQKTCVPGAEGGERLLTQLLTRLILTVYLFSCYNNRKCFRRKMIVASFNGSAAVGELIERLRMPLAPGIHSLQ